VRVPVSRLLRAAFTVWPVLFTGLSIGAQAQKPSVGRVSGTSVSDALTGEAIYRAACVTCHGPDGKGSSRTIVGFDTPLPDFTDCGFATAEADVDWHAVVHDGGRIRGLDRHMPAFGDALSSAQIAAVIGYIRHFCPDDAWPRGDLNFPRSLFTEKAFPENEVVYTNTVTRGDDAAIGNEVVYERRFGARNQIEAVVPVDTVRRGDQWHGGLGDVALAFRRTFLASVRTGTIAAVGGEVAFPTGNADRGLGNGYYVFEPFGMVGQALPHNAFLQMQGGLEIPSDETRAPKEAYVRAAIGFTHMGDRGFGRSWSPQVEVLMAHPFGEKAEWDVVPQLQVSLSKLQHVMLAGGVRIPVNARDQRGTAIVTYLLWDWFDGPFTSFWK
jgi:mono/diheme cytochrome c family protein